MKKTKKKRINKKRVFILLLVIIFIYLFFSNLLQVKIKNIYIYNNKYINDSEIIRKLELDSYPSFLKNAFFLNKRIESDKRIEKIDVSRGLFKLYIKVYEKEPLYIYNERIYFEDQTHVKEYTDVPILINYIPDTITPSFVVKYKNIDPEIRNKISEIEYKPTEEDDERFIFYMKDSNHVYINLKRMELVNDYINIVLRLKEEKEEVKGIFYLDSGIYFESFE